MSYNSLIATAVLDMPLQDDAASTVVVNNAGTDGTLVGGDNTADLSTTGPTTWLPKAMNLDGTNDYITHPAAPITASYTISFWLNCPNAQLTAAGGVYRDAAANASFFTVLQSNGKSLAWHNGNTFTAVDIQSQGWQHVAVSYDSATGNANLYINAVSASLLTSQTDYSFAPTELGRQLLEELRGEIAGYVVNTAAVDVAELHAGPEPVYTSGATLASSGAYDVGTWDAQSNGTATYEWVVVESDGTVVDSGTGATGTADFGATTGLLTLLVRATNDGGYDVGDYATRTSGYGSAGDGYYEVATVILSNWARVLTRSVDRQLTKLLIK